MNDNVTELVAQLTLEEKAALCTGASPWRTVGIERLGIHPIIVADGPHGLRRSLDVEAMITESYPATCFPVAAALAATWDVDLIHQMGQALADESIALNTDIILGPGMNIKRSPLCGRNFEYFSEDPVLSGEIAAALVKGIQSKGVGACVKHFAVNNQETRRFTVDVVVDERALHEIYLAGFEIAIKKAKPWTIMCAYNSVNGNFCSEHPYLLTDILREQWGFDGFIMSDWGAVHERVASLRAGLELEMPGPSPERTQAVISAVKHSELDQAMLDCAVERLLEVILHAQVAPKGHTEIPVEAHHALARRIAAQGIVLLKNDNAALPLRGVEQLAVIGQAAATPVYQGGGSSHINSTRVDTPLEMLRERAELRYALGDPGIELNPSAIDEAVMVAHDADAALLFMALPSSIESEGYDRTDLNLTNQQVALIKAVASVNKKTIVVLNNGSAVDMRLWIDDVDAILEAWLPGQAGAGAIIDILYGDVNPSGKLCETIPLQVEDTPAYLNFPGEGDTVHYGEGIFVGYRGYEKLNRPVLFPFGHGLSYTEFAYSNLRVSAEAFTLGDPLTVSVDIRNIGAVAGDEVVQLYVNDVYAKLPRPHKELKAFAKISLEPGEMKTVTLTLDDRAFSYYDAAYHQWIAEAGEFEILVGSSSTNIQLRQRVTLTKGTTLSPNLSEWSTTGDWLENPHGRQLLRPLMAIMFGGNESDALGVDMSAFFKDLPLITLLRFRGRQLAESPETIVQKLIAEINA